MEPDPIAIFFQNGREFILSDLLEMVNSLQLVSEEKGEVKYEDILESSKKLKDQEDDIQAYAGILYEAVIVPKMKGEIPSWNIRKLASEECLQLIALKIAERKTSSSAQQQFGTQPSQVVNPRSYSPFGSVDSELPGGPINKSENISRFLSGLRKGGMDLIVPQAPYDKVSFIHQIYVPYH